MLNLKKFVFLSLCCSALINVAETQALDYGQYEALFGEPITTSAVGKPQRISDAPISIEIITQEQIKRSAAKDIPDVLRQLSGISVTQTNMMGQDVAIRGYNQPYSNRVLVLIDGRQVYLDSYGYMVWDSLPIQLSEIRQIEIVKGPNTALFGFNAVSGVINILTYHPLYDNINEANLTYGDRKYRNGSVVATGRVPNKFGVKVSGNLARSRDFNSPMRSAAEGAYRNKPKSGNYRIDAGFKLSESTEVRVETSESDLTRTSTFPRFVLANEKYNVKARKASFESDTSYGLWQGNLYSNELYSAISYFDNQGIGIARDKIMVGNLSNIFKIGPNNAFRIFGEHRINKSNNLPTDQPGFVKYQVSSVTGLWDWTINDKLNLINSLRYDHLKLNREGGFVEQSLAEIGGADLLYRLPGYVNFAEGIQPYLRTNLDYNRTIKALSINSGLVYKPTQKDTYILSYARGVDLPSMVELGIELPTTLPGATPAITALGLETGYSHMLLGNPNLKPSIVSNYELSYNRDLPYDTKFKGSVFYQTNKDIQVMPDFYNHVFSMPANAINSNLIGSELGLKGTKGNFRWGMNYTYLHIKDKASKNQAPGTIYYAMYHKSDPRHMASFNTGYSHKNWNFDLYGNMVDKTQQYKSWFDTNTKNVVTGINKVPTQLLLSAKVSYDFNRFTNLSLSSIGFNKKNHKQSAVASAQRFTFLNLCIKY